MVGRDLAVLYGRVVIVMLVFAFVAGIIAGPLLHKAVLGSPVASVQDLAPEPELIRVTATSAAGGQR